MSTERWLPVRMPHGAFDLALTDRLDERELAALRVWLSAIVFDASADLAVFGVRYSPLLASFGIDKEQHFDLTSRPGFAAFGYHEQEPVHRARAFTPFAFSGFYAPPHDDAHLAPTHQAMYVAQNAAGHTLRWGSELEQALVPQPGDVVVMNTHVLHALLPAAGLTRLKAATWPLKFYAVPYVPEQRS